MKTAASAVVLTLMIFAPVSIIAQETDSSRSQEQSGVGASAAGEASSTGTAKTASLELSRGVSSRPPAGQESQPSPPPKPAPTQATKSSPEIKRPRTRGSMVGYIDDAIVDSQVRIRFDAAFHDIFPDRANFIYGTNAKFDPARVNFQQLYFDAEYAPITRFSVFAELPLRWIQPQGSSLSTGGVLPSQAGLSDLRVGFKLAVLASPDRYLTFQFRTYIPTGNISQGLGTGHTNLEPALLYYQKISERLAIESQIGDWHPLGMPKPNGFSGDVFFYGVGPSYELYRGERVRVAPVVELVGWHVASSPQGPAASIVNLKVGARTLLGRHSSVYAGYGRAVTNQYWYRDIARFEYRYSF